ncbi:MAG TPA: hypothetical protein VKB88_47245 [Bryobacteraceae bacterium]|nr:hypothetical protein [Bryobacteraceae bacterium]
MALGARDNRISRRSWLLAGLAIPLFRARADETLDIVFDGDNLRPVLPSLHFLTGKPLDKLKDARTVAFVSQLTLLEADHVTAFRRKPQRFFVSYAIWEKIFKVTIPGATPESRLLPTAEQAENWCLENLGISALGMPPDRPYWLRLDLRTAEPSDLSRVWTDSGFSVSGLIEIFSRKADPKEPHWTMEKHFRLMDLRRTLARGDRNG